MGQKVSPVALRIGINKNWLSQWYADKKDYGTFVVEDEKIRRFINKEFHFVGIDFTKRWNGAPRLFRLGGHLAELDPDSKQSNDLPRQSRVDGAKSVRPSFLLT